MGERTGGAVTGYSERVDAALRLAAAAHQEDVRKGTRIPYVMHPFHVGLILDRHGFSEDVMIAGILHDVLEDPHFESTVLQTRVRTVCPPLATAPANSVAFKRALEKYIAGTFGAAVLDLVLDVTEEKLDDAGAKRGWPERKREQLAALAGGTREHCALKAADCLHNLRAMARDIRTDGARTLQRFNASPEDTLWYYARVADLVSPQLGPGSPIVQELRGSLDDFRAALREAGIRMSP